jgi:DNA-binding HxlR family transcriptional regulator
VNNEAGLHLRNIQFVLDTSPISIEYSLTQRGKELSAAINEMNKWGKKWLTHRMAQSTESAQMPRVGNGAL